MPGGDFCHVWELVILRSLITAMNRSFFPLLILLLWLAGCQSDPGFQTHSSGLKYRFVEKNEGARKVKEGEILVLKLIYKTASDSVLYDYRDEKQLPRIQLNKPSHAGGSIEDALALMSLGDSLEFLVNAGDFFTRYRKMPLPDYIKADESIHFFARLSGIQSFDEVKAERDASLHSNETEETALLEAFLKRANIVSEPTNSGLYYVEQLPGKGKKAQAGKKVSVHYTGKFIDGQVFDSSVERHEPFEFTLGTGEVIQGWDEGIAMMREGGKALLIIPSHLAYGAKQRGPIAPYSTLIFEVELLKVLN